MISTIFQLSFLIKLRRMMWV